MQLQSEEQGGTRIGIVSSSTAVRQAVQFGDFKNIACPIAWSIWELIWSTVQISSIGEHELCGLGNGAFVEYEIAQQT